MAGPPGSGPAAGTGAGGKPRWWTVVVPCLLTLPASAWGLLLGAVAGISSTTGGPDPGPMPTIGDTAAVLAELNALTIPGPVQ